MQPITLTAKEVAKAALVGYEAGKLCFQNQMTLDAAHVTQSPAFFYDKGRPDVSCGLGIALSVDDRIRVQGSTHYRVDGLVSAGLLEVPTEDISVIARIQDLHDEAAGAANNYDYDPKTNKKVFNVDADELRVRSARFVRFVKKVANG